MKAILLAAGFGTRLRPLTDNIPKCLVPIKGKPLLEIWLEKLTNSGVNDIVINAHYLSAVVSQYICKSKYKDNIFLTFESHLLGTAGTVNKVLKFIDKGEDILLVHADNYCLDDLVEFIEYHKNRPKECLMTMMTFKCDIPKNYGIVKINEKNVLINFFEKKENINEGNLANAAIYILSVEFLEIMQKKYIDSFDFSNDIIPYFLNKIYVYQSKKLIVDIGTVENYNKYK